MKERREQVGCVGWCYTFKICREKELLCAAHCTFTHTHTHTHTHAHAHVHLLGAKNKGLSQKGAVLQYKGVYDKYPWALPEDANMQKPERCPCGFSLLLLFHPSVVSNSLQPHGLQVISLPYLYHLPELAQTHVHWISAPLYMLLEAETLTFSP